VATATSVGSHPRAASRRTSVVGWDDFAGDVARRLQCLTSASVTLRAEEDVPRAMNAGDQVLLVTSGVSDAAADRIDAAAHIAGCSWMPIAMTPAVLQIGPLIFPGRSACWRCFLYRMRQHDAHADVTAAVRAAYSNNARLDVANYLPQHAAAAAALAWSALAAPDASAGAVWSVRPETLDVAAASVQRCHGCRRCGAPPDSGDRDDDLLAELPLVTLAGGP